MPTVNYKLKLVTFETLIFFSTPPMTFTVCLENLELCQLSPAFRLLREQPSSIPELCRSLDDLLKASPEFEVDAMVVKICEARNNIIKRAL